jgi:hypothetical protein
VKLRKNGNQTNRQVIHAVVAHVLKRPEDRAFPRARKPGEDDKLAAGSLAGEGFAGGTLHDGKGLAFDPALVGAGNAHVLAVFGNRAPRHLDAGFFQFLCDLVVRKRLRRLFFIDHLLHQPLQRE